MKLLAKVLVFMCLLLCNPSFAATATLLPNAEQQFISGDGTPYAGGSVYFYIPTTTTPKTTWQDAGESVPNTNPVILDASGRAKIYGSGQYRQILFDADGNQVWDQLTQDVYSLIKQGNSIWGGTAGGSANALTLTSNPAITTLSQGVLVSFIALSNNTTATTVNVSGTGIKNILITTSSGTSVLAANNLVAGGRYIMVYDGTEFILLNPTLAAASNAFVTLASATTTDLGTAATNNIAVTGNTTITSFGSSATTNNPLFILQFSGSLQITESGNIATPNNQNLITQGGDYALVRYLGTGTWQVLSYFPASGFIGTIHVQRFAGAGTYTYTASNNLLYATFEVVGAGGGSGGSAAGGNASASGGAGGYIRSLLTNADLGGPQTLTIGAGGTAGAGGSNTAGGSGATTSVGSLITCSGGGGTTGTVSSGSVGGSGGSCSTSVGTAFESIVGQQGGGASNVGGNPVGLGIVGEGGSNPLGFGGPAHSDSLAVGTNGVQGTGAGSGASGGWGGGSGAAGTDGEVIVTEYLLR